MKSASASIPSRPPAAHRPRWPAPPPRGPGAAAFVLRFVVATLAGLAALALLPAVPDAAVTLTARHAAALARALGLPMRGDGVDLVLGALRLEVISECTPLVPIVLVASAMLAFPAPLAHRLIGIAAALPALWIYNLFRVIGLALVLAWSPRLFEFAHVYLWQAVTLAVCVAVFGVWLRLTASAGARE